MKITFPKSNILILNILTVIIALVLMHNAIIDKSYVEGIIAILIASINFN